MTTRYIVKLIPEDLRERDKAIAGFRTQKAVVDFMLGSPCDTGMYAVDNETNVIVAHARRMNGLWDVCIGRRS